MITIADIAKQTGLSTATISNALSGKGRVSDQKRREILEIAEKMGYDFKRIRVRETKKSIAILVETLDCFFCIQMASGICRCAQDHGYSATMYNIDLLRENPFDYVPNRSITESAISRTLAQVDPSVLGLIYVSQYPRDLTGALPNLPYPVVYAYAYTSDSAPCVNTNDQQGAYMAVQHLLSLGRRRIAMLSGPIDTMPMTKRFSGYQRALIDAGLPVDLNLVKLGDWDVEHSRVLMQELLRIPSPPDGVFCQSDHIAVGACRAIRDAGLRIPQDIAVVGFDGQEFAALTSPTLTTVAQPFREIGESAFMCLNNILEKKTNENADVLLKATLIRRESA